MTSKMLAARLHALGEPLSVDTIEVPAPRPTDVLVKVAACGIVPNIGNVIRNWPTWFPHQPLPRFPAIFGLDAAGVVAEVGDAVIGIRPGDRVYVNPLRSCDGCDMCRAGRRSRCAYFTLAGYFSTSPDGQRIFDQYPYGGFAEYLTAPQYSIVSLPDRMSFDTAAKLGYTGTSYHALVQAGAGAGQVGLIDGITGTLGVAATRLALAMGVSRVLGTGRDEELLGRVKDLAPERIEVFRLGGGSSGDWTKDVTDGVGADFVISALGAKAPSATMLDSMRGVRRGGAVVNIGGCADTLPVDVKWLMDEQVRLIGSNWPSTRQTQVIADMVGAGALDMSYLEHRRFPLSQVNEAIASLSDRHGGFSNYVVVP